MITRRFLLAAGAVLASTPLRAEKSQGAPAGGRQLLGDDGQPIPTWRLPSEILIEAPGVISVGGASPNAIVAEFLDYNCPWCKKSESVVDRFVEGDPEFRLLIVQNAILSLGSVQAAKIVLAAKKIGDDRRAYALHRSLLQTRGRVDGLLALTKAQDLKFDRAELERIADGEDISAQLRNHVKTARSLGMETTPSFAAHGSAIGGWPGAAGFAKIIRNLRSCDAVLC